MRSLKIAGVERWDKYVRDTLRIEAALTYAVDTCTFCVHGEQPTEGEEVVIEDSGIRKFAGIIVHKELMDKDLLVWQVDCDDYTALLDRKLVVEVYENMPADEIFIDIAVKYCPDFTVKGVQRGAPVVESTGAEFEYKRPSECYRWLCDYVGWHWQPDYYKDLQFFSAENLASPAPMVLVPGGKFRFGKHSIDTQGLRNRVYVRGGTMLSDPQVVEWKADGVARIWTLPWPPHEVSLQVGEISKTVGIENLHEEADFDYMMSFTEKYIRCSAQTATPVEGITVALTAKQDIDVITMVEDLESQAAVAAVQEDSDGVYEHVINDDSLTTIQAAEAAGYADLREHANPRVKGSFETEVPGWQPGQLVTINLPDRGVTGTFLVQRVSISPTWANPSIWTYRVEYGGRLLGIADFLKALVSAQQKKKMNETAIMHKFVYTAERFEVTDELVTAQREPPFVCGDPDAICGEVVLWG